MSPHLLKRLFPGASASVLAANSSDYGPNNPNNPRQAASVERDPRNEPLAAGQVQEGTDGRFLVRVKSVRKRLADEDGLCEKYVVDCCRYAGWLPDDAPGVCKIETSQRKADKGEAEHTEITITKLP